jgi:hypothetical protein
VKYNSVVPKHVPCRAIGMMTSSVLPAFMQAAAQFLAHHVARCGGSTCDAGILCLRGLCLSSLQILHG